MAPANRNCRSEVVFGPPTPRISSLTGAFATPPPPPPCPPGPRPRRSLRGSSGLAPIVREGPADHAPAWLPCPPIGGRRARAGPGPPRRHSPVPGRARRTGRRPSCPRPPGWPIGLHGQGLDVDGQGPPARQQERRGRSGLGGARRERGAGVGLGEPTSVHLEPRDLALLTESVLAPCQDPQAGSHIALEGQ